MSHDARRGPAADAGPLLMSTFSRWSASLARWRVRRGAVSGQKTQTSRMMMMMTRSKPPPIYIRVSPPRFPSCAGTAPPLHPRLAAPSPSPAVTPPQTFPRLQCPRNACTYEQFLPTPPKGVPLLLAQRVYMGERGETPGPSAAVRISPSPVPRPIPRLQRGRLWARLPEGDRRVVLAWFLVVLFARPCVFLSVPLRVS